jgi:hypothetical protein
VNATTALELLTTGHARPLERFERPTAHSSLRILVTVDTNSSSTSMAASPLGYAKREGAALYFVGGDSEGEILGHINVSVSIPPL